MNEVHTLTRREIAEDLRTRVKKDKKSTTIFIVIVLPIMIVSVSYAILSLFAAEEEFTFKSALKVLLPAVFTVFFVFSGIVEIKDSGNKIRRISEDNFVVRKVVLTDKYVAVEGSGRNSRSVYEFSFNDGMYKIEVNPSRYNSIHSVGDSFYIVLWSPSSTSILEFYNCKGVEYKERLE